MSEEQERQHLASMNDAIRFMRDAFEYADEEGNEIIKHAHLEVASIWRSTLKALHASAYPS